MIDDGGSKMEDGRWRSSILHSQSSTNPYLKISSGIRVIQRVVFHERLKIYHSESAVFWIVAELLSRHALFQYSPKDHAVQRSVTHTSVVLNQIRFSMGGKVDGLLLAKTVVRDEGFRPLLRPMAEGFFVDVHAPEL